MSRLLRSQFSGGVGIDLDGNVGPKGGNQKTDVGAVQFGLLMLSSGPPNPIGGSRGSLVVPGQGTIAVDGFFGPQTAAFINAFQAIRVRSPAPSGFALPKPDGNFGSFRANAWNYSLLESEAKGAGINIIESIRTDGRAPMFLKQAFWSI